MNVVKYNTSQLAKYFGVSEMILQRWLEQKRFVGFEKADGEIPEDSRFVLTSGNKIPVSAVVELWHQQEAELRQTELHEKFLADQKSQLQRATDIGLEKGRSASIVNIAKRMLQEGIAINNIHEYTGLEIDVIIDLQQNQ
jgi:hypothetical protein